RLMYGFNHRHHSSIKHMKHLIQSEEYGKVLWMRGRYGKSVDQNFLNGWQSNKELAGGGILLDQGIHMLDLFLYMGGNFDQVHAFVSNLYWKADIEDNVFAILKNSKTGVVASLHSTMTQWRHLFSLEVFLEKGYMVLNGLKTSSGTYGDEVLSIARNRTTAPAATWEDEDRTTYHSDSFWRSEIDHFMDSVREDAPVKIGN
ncbi:MAG: Gfo/Idh/MocA family oxidoreductase, partial [bacterium]|nr:Gfo/Idh/MocA family oxidoreductase [bacterium]